MASQTTTFYDNQTNVRTAGIAVDSRGDGKLRVIVDTFATTSALTTGSHTLALCRIPKGSKVVSAELLVPASVGTTSAKLGIFAINSDGTLGSAVDDDRYGSA